MEMLYQYLWKHRLLGDRLSTTDGRTVEVLHPGVHNLDSGPDFSGARLRIDGTEWGGNVEVHVKASDWFRHHHQQDNAYDNVILHVVGISDTEVPAPDGKPIPQTVATFPEAFIRLYSRLAQKISEVECEDWLGMLSPMTVVDWMETLTVERMQQKANRIMELRKALDGDWEWACFATLARALGFGLNSEPLEMTARITPLKILMKHSDDPQQVEALLFGQAGMLDTSVHIFDEYYQALCREYFFLARKYGLRPMRRDNWKYSKTRPQNFPARRVALLAATLGGGFSLLSQLVDHSGDIDALRDLFNREPGQYWQEHFDFDTPGTRMSATLSATNIDLLMINFVAPMLYAYGAARGNGELAERGLEIWYSLKPENNRYIRRWTAAGLECRTAAESQALIQLRREYCDRNRCLECRFGHALLRKAQKS